MLGYQLPHTIYEVFQWEFHKLYGDSTFESTPDRLGGIAVRYLKIVIEELCIAENAQVRGVVLAVVREALDYYFEYEMKVYWDDDTKLTEIYFDRTTEFQRLQEVTRSVG